ncbi:hypothetical protein [Vibrio harveyi]|uniref:hypothetical protein n=1 Tax=Vibrio harveyi TaxID=669 RepID=UPI002380AA76|nr:hypothetical protein [Vibrio harveyi]
MPPRLQTKSFSLNLASRGYLGIKARHYEAWKTEVVKIDTATDSIETSFAKLVEKLGI